MSIEQALVARARPHMLAARVEDIINAEAAKGCSRDICPTPAALEPPFRSLSQASVHPGNYDGADYIGEPLPISSDLVRLQTWISPEEKFSWLKSELFLKQIRSVCHRICFEIIGNKDLIQLRYLIRRQDLPIVFTAFRAQFERCEISKKIDDILARVSPDEWNDVQLLDYYPSPPYSHLLTRPDELKLTSFLSLVSALMLIRPPAIGFYQAVFQPANPEHNWHQNVQALLDLEYAFKLHNGIQVPQRYLQQAPSGDLRQMAWEVETKAHNDKPFYFVAIRLAVIRGQGRARQYLTALSTYANLFQNGGHPLQFLDEKPYQNSFSQEKIRDMFLYGITYRPGFLVNSSELCGFVHIPPATLLEYREPPLLTLETFPIRNDELLCGTPIGTCDYAGDQKTVCIPFRPRNQSTHIIGKPGTCKSTLMGHMILDDIEKGMGVVVLDPHGDLIRDLLRLIKKEHIEKTIYFDPGNPDYVPLWNPLKRTPGQSISRTADNLVAAFKTVVSGWGDRLEHLLRHGLNGLIQLPHSTMLDLSNLLRRKNDESKRLQKEILKVVDNETAYQFWKNDFSTYSNEALGPPMHKLSKLLLADRASLMLSQPDNFIDFREIMDSGKILLINLSNIGPEEREILGCFILSLLHLTALSRSEIPAEKRRQFHIHVDEAHRFVTEALEDLIAETRKYNVSLTLAHQYFSQFGASKIDALSSVATTIIMNVDTKDARYLTKDLQKLVNYRDLITLKKGEAIARIDTDIVRFKTTGPFQFPAHDHQKAILEHSFKHYYRPSHEVRKLIRKKGNRWNQPIPLLTDSDYRDSEEFKYDEF